MLDVSNIADNTTFILGYNGIEVMYTVGNGFDGEEGLVNVIMVHGDDSFPFFMML